MTVLGIESSCDETAAAVIGSEGGVLSSIVHSQIDIHRAFGGVVPEVASRQHLTYLEPVVEQALEQAGLKIGDLDGIAVTMGPGLVGCLLTGLSFAKACAWSAGLPIIGVNHLEGHLLAPFLTADPPTFPFIALLVSGGHTSLILAKGLGDYECLGETRDDAAGEAFDKVGKLLGLGYPAGVEIDRLANEGRRDAFLFPRPMMNTKGLEFSFSGLKTAVLSWVRSHGVPQGPVLSDVCASFQEAVVDVLVGKTLRAMEMTGVLTVALSGGVAANSRLRDAMGGAVAARGGRLHTVPPCYCTDNAAMIAWAGRARLMLKESAASSLTADPGLRL